MLKLVVHEVTTGLWRDNV